jgi:glutamate/tyrosine decarboxylase-like PLP-dependent enzyme
VAVTDDWRADTAEMANAIDDNTVLLVGSAPQYPQGVIDDIPTIADLARQRGINCHVDACMGGVILSFLKRLGQDIPPWDLSVPGVSSVSIDLHKFGYTAKGASVMIYANKDLRSYQSFITDNWLGGTYGSSGVLGTKSAGPLAAAWAVMQYLGDEGYLRLAKVARNATLELAQGVQNNLDLKLRAEPESTLFSFGASNPAELNIFAVADELWHRGWYVDRQSPPDSLHCTVNAVHFDKVKSFIDDLNESVKIVKSKSATGESGSYGSVE